MKIHPDLEALATPLDQVRPAENNPRRGNVDRIAESLEANGQYRPIIANRRTNEILAGNHTYLAAAQLGWDQIAVAWVDVDATAAKRILLADNRMSDLASYDDFALLTMLSELDDLTGTGFDDDFVARLEADLEQSMTLHPDPDPAPAGPDVDPSDDPTGTGAYLRVPNIVAALDPDTAATWVTQWASDRGHKDAIRGLARFPFDRPSVKLSKPGAVQRVSAGQAVAVDALTVPIDSINPHPHNPRQGDIGAIAESLAANGQFRPIVVNKRDNLVLAGNHTYLAARSLGWTDIAVTWVDVDDDQARRIILADNRSADAGGYDTDTLADMLESMPTLEGTGFTFDDLDDLLAGNAERANVRPAKTAELTITHEPSKWTCKLRCDWDAYDAWWDDLCREGSETRRRPIDVLIDRLGLTAAPPHDIAKISVVVGDHATHVAPWKSPAAREGVSATDTDNTTWIVALAPNDDVLGFAGVLRHGKGLRFARIKGVWIRPEYRGSGVGAQVTDTAITYATELPDVVRLDAIAINPAFYTERGWTAGNVMPNGGTRVALDLTPDEDSP